jgi:hypothetical protein
MKPSLALLLLLSGWLPVSGMLLTFDELPTQSVTTLQLNGVTLQAFASGVIYNGSISGTAANVDGSALVFATGASAVFTFDVPIFAMEFDLASPVGSDSIPPIPPPVIFLFTEDNQGFAQYQVPFITGAGLYEHHFSHAGTTPIKHVLVSAGFHIPMALDNFAYSVPEQADTLALLALALAALIPLSQRLRPAGAAS